MRRSQPHVAAAGLLFSVGILAFAPDARALGWLDCGPRWDYCSEACDDAIPGRPPLAICHNNCNIGVSICEASRIPSPASQRRHARYTPVRK
jgi:hypothetical protein